VSNIPETSVKDQPKHLSRISRISVKDQVTTECPRSTEARHDLTRVPPARHFLHLCTDDLGYRARGWLSRDVLRFRDRPGHANPARGRDGGTRLLESVAMRTTERDLSDFYLISICRRGST
jgi:hypothetical protein